MGVAMENNDRAAALEKHRPLSAEDDISHRSRDERRRIIARADRARTGQLFEGRKKKKEKNYGIFYYETVITSCGDPALPAHLSGFVFLFFMGPCFGPASFFTRSDNNLSFLRLFIHTHDVAPLSFLSFSFLRALCYN